eukprot:756033-Hanusia_phi.AAC.1
MELPLLLPLPYPHRSESDHRMMRTSRQVGSETVECCPRAARRRFKVTVSESTRFPGVARVPPGHNPMIRADDHPGIRDRARLDPGPGCPGAGLSMIIGLSNRLTRRRGRVTSESGPGQPAAPRPASRVRQPGVRELLTLRLAQLHRSTALWTEAHD